MVGEFTLGVAGEGLRPAYPESHPWTFHPPCSGQTMLLLMQLSLIHRLEEYHSRGLQSAATCRKPRQCHSETTIT